MAAVIICGNANALSPAKMIKSPVNYIKELMGFKKELKERAVEKPVVIEGMRMKNKKRFKRVMLSLQKRTIRMRPLNCTVHVYVIT